MKTTTLIILLALGLCMLSSSALWASEPSSLSPSSSLHLSSQPRYYLTEAQKRELTLTLDQASRQVISLQSSLRLAKESAASCSIALADAEASSTAYQRKYAERRRKTATILAITIPIAFIAGAVTTTAIFLTITK